MVWSGYEERRFGNNDYGIECDKKKRKTKEEMVEYD